MLQKIGLILHLIFLGLFLSYLMNPFTAWFQKKYEQHSGFFRNRPQLSRAVAVFSCLLTFFLLFLLGIRLLVYNSSQYFDGFSWELFLKKIKLSFDPVFSFFEKISRGKFSRIYDLFFSMSEEKMKNFFELVVSAALSFPSYLGQFFVSLIFALYLLMEKDRIFSYGKKMGKQLFSPKRYYFFQTLVHEFHKSFSGYLKGQALDVLLMSILLSAGLGLIGVPLGISIGILAGIGNFVPYLGGFLSYTFTLFFCLLEGKFKTLGIALIYLFLIQLLDGNYIGPRLLGNQTKLRPVLIFIAVFTGGTLFGPLGMVFAVPFTGLFKSMIEILSTEKSAYTVTEEKEGENKNDTAGI
jgi:predicted PurR-regulated permease PerM